ncbi:MAG TPA: polymer-forming cytoskeletal protein [Steroidobacteraceae bacterium]|jgi:cytoskeletal protein CcmA (bactofilin family)|nr:polymer-forming cytoskeletal protein [Steroidobacteraceae bacterium]
MFNRRKTQIKPFQIDTLIGAGTRINGDVQFSGGLHLDGTVVGNVTAEAATGSKLSVSDSGTVEGSINVATVVLNGTVQGDIVAATRVDLGSTAKVNGNVYYGLIEMAMGAQINGKLIHQSATTASAVKTVDPPAATVVELGNTAKSKLG